MRTVMVPIRPPFEVQRRAWECAVVLRDEFADRLTLAQNIRAEVVCRLHPDQIGWAEIGDMLALYPLRVEARA